jgi:ankyrin repeat protein
LKTVQWLLSADSGLALQRRAASNGNTAFLCAAWNGALETVQWLQSADVVPGIAETSSNGNTALLWAGRSFRIAFSVEHS